MNSEVAWTLFGPSLTKPGAMYEKGVGASATSHQGAAGVRGETMSEKK